MARIVRAAGAVRVAAVSAPTARVALVSTLVRLLPIGTEGRPYTRSVTGPRSRRRDGIAACAPWRFSPPLEPAARRDIHPRWPLRTDAVEAARVRPLTPSSGARSSAPRPG